MERDHFDLSILAVFFKQALDGLAVFFAFLFYLFRVLLLDNRHGTGYGMPCFSGAGRAVEDGVQGV